MSTILMAMVDANLRIICIDIGGYGQNSDGGTFQDSRFGKGLASGKLHIPAVSCSSARYSRIWLIAIYNTWR